MDVYITQTILGIIGTCIGVGLFLTPTPTFMKILKHKTDEDISPTPYMVALMSCLVWILYGVPQIHPYSTTILYVNGTGIALQTLYIITFAIYCNRSKKRVVIMVYVIEVLVVVAIAIMTITFVKSTSIRTLVIGFLCCTVTIMTSAYSLLIILKKIIRTKGVEGISIFLILVELGSATVWTAYAFFPLDPFMAIANGVSMAIGVVQVFIFALYKKAA